LKPTFIFSAVLVVSAAMALFLPGLASAPPPDPAALVEPLTATMAPADQAAVVVAPNPFANTAAQSEIAPTAAVNQAAPHAGAAIPPTSLSNLDSFAASLVNNIPTEVVGIYAPDLFALPVEQQPPVDHNYIAPYDGTLTQYGAPMEDGTIAMLAHNYLSGRSFFNLQPGQEIVIVYGDGHQDTYTVTGIDEYQALSPTDPFSDFIDLDDPSGALQSYQQVYNRYYTTPGLLVLQTCIENNGDWSWGRLFVVAEPA
jgi:hypothetical protein